MKKYKMLVVCPHPEKMAPGQRLKYEQYFEDFRRNNIEVTVKSFMTVRFQNVVYKKGHFLEKIFWTLYGYWQRFILLFSIRRYDISYIFLWVTPFGPPFFEWMYTKLSRKVVYDIDDLVYLKGVKSKANPISTALKGRNKPIYMMKHADRVITCTPYLDEFVRKYNNNTTDISSTINTEKYIPKTDYTLREGKAIFGWSGSLSTSRYLHLLDNVFKRLKADGVQFKVLVMGDESFSIEGIEVEALPWKEEYEVEVIKRFDIGLYPLPDEEWVLGKSSLKALQYMGAGVPVIATAIGTNFRVMEHASNGLLVKTEDEWVEQLKSLTRDESLRKKLGEKGAQVVEEKFSIHANSKVYLGILKNLIAYDRTETK